MEQVTLDLIPVGAKTVCHASQYDIGRTIRFNLVNNNQPVTLAGTETIVVKITKPDGTKIEKYLSNTSSTYVDWVTGEGDCDQAGIYNCEIKLTDGSAELGSKNFTIKVEEDPYNGEEVITETASGDPAVFTTNLVDLFVEIKCNINAVQNGTPWIDSNIVNKEPYLFRKIAGTASRIGNSEFNKIVGGTVAWNQNCQIAEGALLENVATKTYSNGVWTFTATDLSSDSVGWYAAYSVKANHVCFIATDVNPTNNITMKLGMIDRTLFNVSGGTYTRIETLRKQDIDARPVCYAMLNGQGLSSFSFSCKNVNFIDLTQMLGPAIADYIYSLETATAGAGVAWFRKYYPAAYYAYNAGSLMSSIPVAKRVIGKNLFNYDLCENLGLDNEGNTYPATTRLLSSVFKVCENTGCIITIPSGITVLAWCEYSDETTFLRRTNVNATGSVTLTPTTRFIRLYMAKNDMTANISKSDVSLMQLEIGSTATAYEPYTAHEYILNGSRKVHRVFSIVDLGTLTWTKQEFYGSKYGFLAYLTGIKPASSPVAKGNILCDSYITRIGNDVYLGYDGISMWSTEDRISIYDSTKESLTEAQFKTAMSGKYLVYELETPFDETVNNPELRGVLKLDSNNNLYYYGDTCSDFTNPISIDANGSEAFIDGNVYDTVTLDGSEGINWQTLPTGDASLTAFYISVSSWESVFGSYPKRVASGELLNAISNELEIKPQVYYTLIDSSGIYGWTDNSVALLIVPPSGVADLNTWLASNNLTIIYEKATSTGVEMPVGHESFYADIYDITGFTELNLDHTGKNKFNNSVSNITDGSGYCTVNGNTIINTATSAWAAVRYEQVFLAGNYCFHASSITENGIVQLDFDNNGVWEAQAFITPNQLSFNRQIPSTTKCRISIYSSGANGVTVTDLMAELGSSASPYEPYAGELVTVAFGQTVYTGVLNVGTGVFTALKGFIDFGDLDWTYSGAANSTKRMATYGLTDLVKIPSSVSDVGNINTTIYIAKSANDTYTQQTGISIDTSGVVLVYDSYYNTAESVPEFKQARTGQKILYELETPVEIQLTAHQLETILGQNILSHDCNGTTEVKYLYNA